MAFPDQRSSSLHEDKRDTQDKAAHGYHGWVQSTLNGGVLTAGQLLEFQRFKLGLKRPPRWLLWAVLIALFAFTMVFEMRTAAFQSRILHLYAKHLTYIVGSGPSHLIVFPKAGPFNLQRGYTEIPEFEQKLGTQGFEVTQQSRFSPSLVRLSRWGVTPPFRSPGVVGLLVRSSEGMSSFASCRRSPSTARS